MRFNLLEDPWLPVIPLNESAAEEVSLVCLLGNARRYRRLAGTTPTMTAALHRTVLALIHRVYGPASLPRWGELWHAERGFPVKDLASYAAAYRDRFELFDSSRPFMQCPALAGKEASSTAKLVAYRAAGSNTTLFDHTTAGEMPIVAPAEAARWLVTTQMYDTGGTKTPFTKTRTSETGLGNRFGCVLVEGASLHETLLLNTVIYDPAAGRPWMTSPQDCPAWETDQPPGPEPDERPPSGWTDLLTWPARRVLLRPGHDYEGRLAVTGVVLAPGTQMRASLVDVELMAAFTRPWLKDKGRGPMKPITLGDVSGVWRHSRDLLLSGEPLWRSASKSQRLRWGGSLPIPASEPERLRPEALNQIAEASTADLIATDAVYTLRVFGQKLLENKAGATHAWYEEAIPAPVALIRATDERTGNLIGHAVTLAAHLGEALGEMQRSYRKAFGVDIRGDKRRRASAEPTMVEIAYWPRLATPFADFLRELGLAVGRHQAERDALNRWCTVVVRVSDNAAGQWLSAVPRRDRGLIAAVACHDDYQRARNVRVKIFRGGVERFTSSEPEAAA
jgi:CRISPR system Cascade subunit CasA